MNRDDVIRMALEAGFMLSTNYGEGPHKLQPVSDSAALKRFAALVATAEREDIERVLYSLLISSSTAKYIASAIRARGAKP